MKAEKTETVVFVKVSYTCDVCGKALQAGRKPHVCEICGKEVCAECAFEWLSPTGGPDPTFCRPCYDAGDNYLQDWDSLGERVDKEVGRIKQLWREETITLTKPRGES